MNDMEQQLSQLSVIKHSVSRTNTKVAELDEHIKELQSKSIDFEQNFQSYSLYDDIVTSNTENDTTMKNMLGRLETLEENQRKGNKKMIDVQWRTMRENLIFTGIQEPELIENEFEDVEKTLRSFLRNQMKIERSVEFDRVHRLGRYDRHRTYPRPIIAKFEKYKDKEYVRQAAPDALSNTNYGVREQFPKEIEEKRKLLYPIAKKERQNPENKVRFVRDKLYINDREVKATETHIAEKNVKNTNTRTNDRTDHSTVIRSRTVYSKHRSKPNWGRGATLRDTPNYHERPLQNRFSALLETGENTPDKEHMPKRKSTKNKASSLLDRDMTFKKHKEGHTGQADSDTNTDSASDVEMDAEDCPRGLNRATSRTYPRVNQRPTGATQSLYIPQARRGSLRKVSQTLPLPVAKLQTLTICYMNKTAATKMERTAKTLRKWQTNERNRLL